MGVMREEDALDNVMEKSKKRKREYNALGGEDSNARLGDESHKKKMKTEASGDTSFPEEIHDVDSNIDVKSTSKNEKQKKYQIRIDVNDQGNDNIGERRKKKSKIGDEKGAFNVLEDPDENIHVESEGRGFSELQRREREKNHVGEIEKIDGNNIKLKGKKSVIKSHAEVANDFEPVREGDKQAGREGQVKESENKKKTMTELKRKEIDSEVIIEKVEIENKKKRKRKEEEEDNLRGTKRKKKKSAGFKTKVDSNEPSQKSTLSKKAKKVGFSGHVEVFCPSDDSSEGKNNLKDNSNEEKNLVVSSLIRGKRFSEEEDGIVRNAVLKYIEDYNLGEEGLEMILKCRLYPKMKGCWKKIGKALPCRPYLSVYTRAHKLFERGETRKWTPEELELVKKFHEEHGPAWRRLADQMGKHPFHVREAWERIRLPNRKKGKWSQEEYESLFDLVNMDLSMKAFDEKKSKHGMLRDNISWSAISQQLSTRIVQSCCAKWYRQLTSSMVAEGKWADTDDYRLLIILVDIDAACEEDVDWDNLIEHRSGDVCRKRWIQMVRHIGEHGTKSFGEQVEILSQRYRLDILESREAYDSKTPVD